MTVLIEKTDGRYSWLVRVGRGRGGTIKSRHYKKSAAKATARQLAKRRGDVLKEQMQSGVWRTVRSYG